ASLEARDRRTKQLVDLDPEWLGVAAEDREHRLADGRSFLGVERPLHQTRKLRSEHGVGVANRLRDDPGDALLEERSTSLPIEAARGAQEDRPGLLVASRRVGLESGTGFAEECLCGRHREERGFEQHERVNALRSVERELQRNRGAARMASDVSARNIEVV